MSFYVDPWLYNCTANPADSPTPQAEQRAIIAAMNRALDYAHRQRRDAGRRARQQPRGPRQARGPTPSSPDYPAGTAYARPIDNATCVDLPVEGPHVIGVSALGPVGAEGRLLQLRRRADLGLRAGRLVPRRLRHADLPHQRQQDPLDVPAEGAAGGGPVDADGNITPAGEGLGVQGLHDGRHLRVLHLPAGHLDGLAARGRRRRADREPVRHADPFHGGLPLARRRSSVILDRTAAEHACPMPPLQTYTTRAARPSSTRSARAAARSTASTATASSTPTPR